MRASWRKSLLIVLTLAMPNVVFAQTGQIGSYNRPRTNTYPSVSPYLNMGRGGSNPAVNYYGIVRPQVDTNRAFQQLDPSMFGGDPRFGLGGAAIGPDGNPIPGANQYLPDQTTGLSTGHPATYFYYSHYYQMQPGQRSAAGGAGGNSNFGRPNTTATPFYSGVGGGGVILPINPGGANPLGGSNFGTQPQVPGQIFR